MLAGLASPAVVHLSGTRSSVYQAAVQSTATSNAYFVSSYACSGCVVDLATISGTPPYATLSEKTVGAPGTSITTDPAIPGGQLGGSDMDTRVLTAVYEVESSDNKPVIAYTANTECVPSVGASPTVCISLGRIDLSSSTPALSVTNIGAKGRAYSYGAVALDGYGRAYISYSISSSTAMPSAAVLGYWGGKVAFNTVIQSAVAGTSCGAPAPCDERWGDYLGATQDPSDSTKVWLAGLYQASSGEFGWGTAFTRASSAGVG